MCAGVAAGGQGVDVVLEDEDSYTVISVKSGPNWGNSSQMAKLQRDFDTASRVFLNKKMKKHYRAVLGHCYGAKMGAPSESRSYYVLSGQCFWQELTGDAEFYIKIIHAMGEWPSEHRIAYEEEWSKAVNKFSKQFLDKFCNEDGSINWERLVQLNSAAKPCPRKV